MKRTKSLLTEPEHRPVYLPLFHLWALMGVLAVSALPHLFRFPWPIVLFLVAVWGACVVSVQHTGTLPRTGVAVRAGLVVALLLLIKITMSSFLNREAGVCLLLGMLVLKLLEMRSSRDVNFLAMWILFLTLGHVLFGQSLAVALMVAAIGWLNISLLLVLARPEETHPSFRQVMGRTGMLVGQALPVMLVMFVFFPRLSGPLLAMPNEMAGAGRSGLSEFMEPGSISNLVLSDRVAFRVQFEGSLPEPRHRYWRGPVFWHFDGRTWRGASLYREDEAIGGLEPRSLPVAYWVTMEPHQNVWYFVLDLPASRPPAGVKQSQDFQWRSEQPVDAMVRYAAVSHLDYRADDLLHAEQETLGLQLPVRGNPRAVQLARQWATESDQPGQVVAKALAMFREEPFHYTLEPPLLEKKDAVDEFLFSSRRGFCEHFAGAFTFLMRAAGLPARVVTGYQGGVENRLEHHLTIRQSDAHAWSEVWLPGSGWVRVDPTAAVAPQRIERGLASANLTDAQVQEQARRFRWPWFLDPWQVWDTMDHRWNLWVVGFGRDQQINLLNGLGMDGSWPYLTLILVTTVTSMLLLVALHLWWQQQRGAWQRDPALRQYERFCRRLAQLGCPRLLHEGPLDFANRAGRGHPALAAWIHQVTRTYVAIRYEGRQSVTALRQLARLVRQPWGR